VGKDGCPDDDPDGDHVRGTDDKCPEDAEDLDGFQDQDGCPDTDNDKDGIPDSRDGCPDTKETVNGIMDDDGCPEVEGQMVVVTKRKIEILEKVYFDTGRSTIQSRSHALLDAVADAITENRQIGLIRIEGHTDDRGSEAYNLRLSQRRAAAIRTYLVEVGGISERRLVSVGYGAGRPLVANDTKEGRARNRRAEFVILDAPGPRSVPTGTDVFDERDY
jgi:outer membrane protein OmpA-like peptidoglycan-associated protein